jgi:ABC-type Fe3+/spermidine/putrescine transport system ATPase subunit
MVFQDYALFPHLNARANVAFGLKVRGIARVERDRRADEMLATLGLEGMGDRMPRQLSGGQRQRVAMGRSLILEPRVLLLDEPLGALDAQVRRQLQVELRQLQRRLGLTFVYVTHDQEEAMALSDRIVVMNKGRLIQDGPPEEVYRRPRSTFVARFLGDCNLLLGRPTGSADGRLVIELEGLGRVRVARPDEPFATDSRLTLALRPEDVALTEAGNGRIDGRIRERTFLGANTRYVVEAGGLRIEAIVDQATVLEPGVTAGLAWDDANLTVVAVETASASEPPEPTQP